MAYNQSILRNVYLSMLILEKERSKISDLKLMTQKLGEQKSKLNPKELEGRKYR